MKRVAFLSFDWDYEIMSEYYLGLQDYLRGRTDTQCVIYSSFGNYYASHRPQLGAFEIYSLCDPLDYDGLLIQGNRTWPPELRQKIVDRFVELGKPVVSINYELRGAHSVGTNNYQEEFELVRRILRDRGRVRPVFVNGLKTSVEAKARAQGFRDACAEAGIEGARVHNANWQLEAGVATAKKLLRRRDDLPDVVFCCNDDLAVGVIETLQAAGLRVPEDLMVTGFDNREIGLRTTPRITTIDRDYRTIATTALGTLVRLMNGEDQPMQVFSPARHVLTGSCGYNDGFAVGHPSLSIGYEQSLKRFYEALSDYQSAILGSESLYAIMENCERFAREIDCPNLFISLNEDYLKALDPEGVMRYGNASCLVARKERDLTMSCDDDHVYARFGTRALLPPEVPLDGPIYMVLPLRHNDSCIGMMVTEGVAATVRHGFLSFFITMLSAAVQADRKSALLRAATERLAACASLPQDSSA